MTENVVRDVGNHSFAWGRASSISLGRSYCGLGALLPLTSHFSGGLECFFFG